MKGIRIRAYLTRLMRTYAAGIVLSAAILGLGLAYPALRALALRPPQEADSPYLRTDPEKIVLAPGDDRVPCGECHSLEYDTWKATPHATGFDTMHRSQQAQSILERMDFRLSKRESLCLRCHYTAEIQNGQARAIAGVSCESCHGAARDWLDLHNNYDGATHETETEAHRQQRAQASAAAGMLRPSENIYAVAANCFECHTVPSEKLINVGRHPSGSKIELVEWTGEISHNFLQAQWSNDEQNRERTPERKRLLYVVGRMLDYEYSIRAAAEATEAGSYAKANERRVASAVRELERVMQASPIPELGEILRLHKDVRLAPNNRAGLLATAEKVRDAGQRAAARLDGGTLAALDPLIEGRGAPVPEPDDAPAAEVAELPASEPAPTATPSPAAGEQAPATAAPSAPVAVRVAGEKRSKPAWFPNETYEVTLPGCNCHGAAEDWLFSDAHGRSAAPVANGTRKALQIAQLYGLTPAQMKQGDQICMQCHGTVESGSGSAQVFESVGCESCHGPSSGYLSPHKRGQGFQNGLVDLRDIDVRAANCARCHHITDERLLASGHSSGEGYNIQEGNGKIKHWPDPDLERPAQPDIDSGALRAAFDRIKQQRPVPRVEVARAPEPPPSPPAAAPVRAPATRTTVGDPVASAPPRPPRPRAVARGAAPTAAPSNVTLPPLPAVADSASAEEVLRIVKERLEALYKALGRDE
ncbi:MAG: multiheme c-type cytochrome [Rhodothermales bacterium]